jgi:hypothetical protein
MYRFVVALVLTIAVAVAAAPADESPPTALKEPAVQFAGSTSRKLEADDAAWHKVTSDLLKALEAYEPGSLNLKAEDAALAALRAYVLKLLESGREVVTLHEKWSGASASLADSLRKAGPYYREAARVYRGKADAAKFEAVREQYLIIADTWDGLAGQAERRAEKLGLDRDRSDLLPFLKENNEFLESLLDTLDALPKAPPDGGAQYERLLEAMRKHVERFEEFRKNLKLFRDKVAAGSFSPAVRALAARERQREAAEKERAEVAQFVARQGFDIRNVSDGWASLDAPRGAGVVLGQTLTYYRLTDRVRPAGSVKVVSAHDGFFVVRAVTGTLQDHDFALRPGAKLPAAEPTDPTRGGNERLTAGDVYDRTPI